MPIYEYKCNRCHALCDILHKMDEEPLIKCHSCGKKMKRQISAPNFILPVYRPEELLRKKDTKHSERDYKRKLSSSPKLK
jgi:putative FmdB family regulatory protein